MVCLSRTAGAIGVVTQHQHPRGYSLSSLPKASMPSLSSYVCSPLCPLFAKDLLSPSVVNLVTLHSEFRLESHSLGQNPSWLGGYCSFLGCCYSEGSGLPEQDGCCSRSDDSALGSQWLLSQFSPQSLCTQSLLKCL